MSFGVVKVNTMNEDFRNLPVAFVKLANVDDSILGTKS